MMSITLSTVIRVANGMTLTSGLSALSVRVADSTFGLPMSAVVWRIWRCRLVMSTTSPSITPSVPTEAAGADQQHLGAQEPPLALLPDLLEEEVAAVPLDLIGAERQLTHGWQA